MAKTKLYTFYMGLYGAPARHVFKMASPAVTWMLSSNLWRTKSRRSGQIYHIVLPREAYYSSQLSRVCERCACKFGAVSHSPVLAMAGS